MKFIFAAIASSLLSLAAHAGDHAYVQFNMGSTSSGLSSCHVSWDATHQYGAGEVQGADCNVKGPAGKLLAGYKVTPSFAFEATYWKLGEEYSSDPVGEFREKLAAYGLGVALHFDITEDWSGVGRFGFARIKAKSSHQYDGVLGISPSIDDGSSSHAKYYAGAGIAYRVAPMLKLHGDFDYTKTRSTNASEHGLSLLSVGASLNF